MHLVSLALIASHLFSLDLRFCLLVSTASSAQHFSIKQQHALERLKELGMHAVILLELHRALFDFLRFVDRIISIHVCSGVCKNCLPGLTVVLGTCEKNIDTQCKDTFPPRITLIGSTTMTIQAGSSYIEPGYS